MPTNDAILALNSGSSSLKFGVFIPSANNEQLIVEGSAEGIGRTSGSLHIRNAAGDNLVHRNDILESQPEALNAILSALRDHTQANPIAVGHRVVHGGPRLREHTRITPQVLATLEASIHFAPLHIPQSLTLIRQVTDALPGTPQFACFDTTFHRTMPEVAAHLPIPTRFYESGVMRYGFHGLSYESVVARLNPIPARVVIAHLGNGSSITAVLNGRSIDTSMGLTPTGGSPMGTRTGDLDPGVLIYLLRNEHLSPDALEDLVNHQCGLFAFSNGESDMQALLAREASHDPTAALAIDAFCTAIRKTIGAYAALLGGGAASGGLDLLVFTGGIGQHSAAIRNRITAGLDFLGLNPGKILALPAQEELQIARHTRVLLRT